MNNLGETTTQNLYPPALFGQNFGTWSLIPVISQPEKICSTCIFKRGGVGEITRDNDRVCLHCGNHFRPKNRIQHFCKDGCRTYYHRKKRNALVPAMLRAYGVGYDHALDVLETSGISRVISAMAALGYSYNGKAWVLGA